DLRSCRLGWSVQHHQGDRRFAGLGDSRPGGRAGTLVPAAGSFVPRARSWRIRRGGGGGERSGAGGAMNRFAALLDRLAFEHGRNAKLRLMTEHFRTVPDPERGFALAALTGALSFRHAKPSLIHGLIAERTDPVLFGLSYDYVGDLSETVALMWPGPAQHSAGAAPSLTEVVTALATLGKAELPGRLAHWLDLLDETGRWALLKLVTGALRIGVSARLAKTAVAALGGKDTDEIELI